MYLVKSRYLRDSTGNPTTRKDLEKCTDVLLFELKDSLEVLMMLLSP
jgi:hypothetical protein